MALTFADRVRETTTTAGTGTLDLAGAVDTYQGFVAGAGDASTVVYAIIHRTANEWEVGEGTVTDAIPDTLSRDTIRDGSNGSSAVNFSAGTKDVYLTMGASDIEPDLQADVNETITGAWTFQGDVTLDNTDDVATVVPLTIRGNRATPADGDTIAVDFTMHDSGGNDANMARLEIVAADVTNASEDSTVSIYNEDGGSRRSCVKFASAATTFNADNEARDFIVRQGDAIDALTITKGGGFGSNIGIYNESPTEALDVVGNIRVGDDDQIQFGAAPDYWMEYDATGTQLRIRSSNVDGGGTDGTVMSVADGTDDVVFEGAVTTKAAGDSMVAPVGTDKFAT